MNRILIIDDDNQRRAQTQIALSGLGYELVPVNERGALRALAVGDFALTVVEYEPAEVIGIDLLAALDTVGVPIIALCGLLLPQAYDYLEGLEAVRHVLVRPLDEGELRRAAADLLPPPGWFERTFESVDQFIREYEADLVFGGVFVPSTQQPEFGDEVTVRLVVPLEDKRCTVDAAAVVVSQRPDGFTVEFVEQAVTVRQLAVIATEARRGRVVVRIGRVAIPAELQTLDDGELALSSRVPIDTGRALEVSVALMDGAVRVSGVATSLELQNDGRYAVGIQFEGESERDRQRLLGAVRNQRRAPLDTMASLEGRSAQCIDVSVGGVGVKLTEAIEPGSVLDVCLRVPNCEAFEESALVRWVAPDEVSGWRAGLVFAQLSESSAQCLADYVDRSEAPLWHP